MRSFKLSIQYGLLGQFTSKTVEAQDVLKAGELWFQWSREFDQPVTGTVWPEETPVETRAVIIFTTR
jgi:hypothetical protein